MSDTKSKPDAKPESKAKAPAGLGPLSLLRWWWNRLLSHWAVRMMVCMFVLDGALTTCSSLRDGERPPIVDRAVTWVDWLSHQTDDPPSLPHVELGS